MTTRSRGASCAPTRRAQIASFAYWGAGGGWVALHAAGALGPLEAVTFAGLAAVTLAATVFGVRRHQPSVRWPWRMIAFSMAGFLVGGALREQYHTLGDLTSGRSLLPDLFTLPGYILFAAGLCGLLRARRLGRANDVDALLDGTVAGLAALTLAWLFLVNPALYNESAPLSVRLSLACYPPMSVFFVIITARLAFSSPGALTPSHRALLSAMTMMLLGDLTYTLVETHILAAPRNLIDVPYAFAYLAFSFSAAHPSMRQLSEPAARPRPGASRGRLVLVAVALGIPAAVSLTREDMRGSDRAVLAACIVLLTVAAVWRVIRALHAHAAAEARSAHQATHDALTGLPNRLLLTERLSQALHAANESGSRVAVLFLDIDRFKLVNDSAGHSMGDELLVAAVDRITAALRPSDLLARIGGDEFIVILDDVGTAANAIGIAERIRLAFHPPFTIRGVDIYSSASIGISISDHADETTEEMIRDADTAMYQAKDAGRDALAVFDASMRDQVADRLALEHDLHNALGGHQLHVHYQPIVRLPDGTVDGFEALIRWTHPTRGNIPPLAFVPLAEETGLIVEIGRWVLSEACRAISLWRRMTPGGEHLTMAVNLSVRQLQSSQLVADVASALEANGLPADALCLELTESLLMENPDAASQVLQALRRLGVRLSIDDFGTGYSSLAYLHRFPVDQVKIDKSFVDGLTAMTTSESSLVAAIIAMAEALGMKTVAEGVETAEQASQLAALGSTRAQGYLYSRPLPPEDIPAALEHIGVNTVSRGRRSMAFR
ncbi:MAG: putative bifunctional diguanylate cyclase/phosphodiesterase [Acidimicrobiales bacterium]